jgi:hypothetical protein
MLLVLGGGCHLFLKHLGEHLLLLVVRVHFRPGKWTNTCRACRRGTTGGVARRRNIARRHVGRRKIGWWGRVGGGTAKFRQPAGGLARGGAGRDRATRGERGGFATRLYGLRVLSSIERACSRFYLVRSPPACPGGPGMAWARRMDESPNPKENEEPGARLGRFSPSE